MTATTKPLSEMTGDELTAAMAALENSGRTYAECAEEYEALSAARDKTDWMPDWLRRGVVASKRKPRRR